MTKSNTRAKKIAEYVDQGMIMIAGVFAVCWGQGLPWLVFFSYSLGVVLSVIIKYIFSIYAKPSIKRQFS